MGRALPYVGAVVGAVIGAYVGGVQGAIYGAEIGYSIGGLIAASNQKIVNEGPRLSDLKTSFSANGIFIPRIYVHAGGIGGNFIDATDLIPSDHQTSSSGKGGPTTVNKTTTYSASFRKRVCASPGGNFDILRIWANGNLIFSRVAGTDATSIVATQGTVGGIIVYRGGEDQLPDPTQEAMHGIGNVPAHIGYLDVMFVDFQLANFANNLEATQLTYEVVQVDGTTNYTEPAPLDSRANGSYPMLDDAGITVFAQVIESIPSVGDVVRSDVYVNHLDGAGAVKVGQFMTSNFPIVGPYVDGQLTYFPSYTFDGVVNSRPAKVFLTTLVDGDAGLFFYQPTGQLVNGLELVGIESFRNNLPKDSDGHFVAYRHAASDADGVLGPVDPDTGIALDPDAGIAYSESTKPGAVSPVTGMPISWLRFRNRTGGVTTVVADAAILQMLLQNGKLYVLRATNASSTSFHFDCKVYDLADGSVFATLTGLPPLAVTPAFDLFLSGTSLQVVAAGSILLRWTWLDDGSVQTGDVVTNPIVPMPPVTNPGGGTGSGPAYVRTLAYGGPDYGIVAASNGFNTGSIVSVAGRLIDANPTRPLSEVIAAIAAEKGVTNLDFTALPDTIVSRGYIITRQTSPRVAIDYLRDLHRVDCADSADKIKFVLRGGDAVATLTTDELGAIEGDGDPPQAVAWTVADELSLPAIVNMKFADKDNKFEIGNAVARRENTTSQEAVTLDVTAVVLSADEAAQLAEQALVDHRLVGQTVRFSTTYAHDVLETADPIIVPGRFKNRRVRTTSRTDKGGVIEWEAVRDEPSNLTQFVKGGSAGGGRPSESSIVVAPVALADVLNLPSLRTVDDDAGCYLYIAPTTPARYRGAVAYDAATAAPRVVGSVTDAGVSGFTTSALGGFAGIGLDSGSSVDVKVGPGVRLQSTTPDRLAAGENVFLIGDEIVGVLTTTALGNDVWRLHGGLLRGMRGTDAAIALHGPSEKVFWLTPAGLLRDATAPAGAITVGAVTVGRSLNDLRNFATAATNTSQALVPFAPLYLTSGTGPAATPRLFKWQRRSRKIQSNPFSVALDDGAAAYALELAADATFTAPVTKQVSAEAYSAVPADLAAFSGTFYARVAQLDAQGRPGAFSPPITITR